MAEKPKEKPRAGKPMGRLEVGLLPPQSLDVEEVILGAMLIEKEALHALAGTITSDMFYLEKHALIFKAIEKLYKDKDKAVDIVTVVEELKRSGKLKDAGGAYEVTTLTNRVGSGLHAEFHADILRQKYISRQIIAISSEASKAGYKEEEDPIELIRQITEKLRKLESGNLVDEVKSTEEIFNETFDQMKLAKDHDGVLGLECHLTTLNDTICGFQGGFVYIVAGRPGMGKSALMKSIVLSLIQKKIKCRIFSLEMTASQLAIGLTSENCEFDNQKVAKGQLNPMEWERLNKAKEDLKDYIIIDDKPAITIGYLESQVRKAVEDGVQLIAIDYLQLMTLTKDEGYNKSREQEISFLSSNVKRIAKQYNIPAIVLSQLSRAVEDRPDKIPRLSDLRDSGSIEQDAEVVIFCYRPEYYKIYENPKTGESYRGLAKLMVAKNRFGPLDDLIVKFYPTYTKYDNFESSVKLNDSQNEMVFTGNEKEEDDF